VEAGTRRKSSPDGSAAQIWEFAAHLHPEQRHAMACIRGSPHLTEVATDCTASVLSSYAFRLQVGHALPPPLALTRGGGARVTEYIAK
jgi:hypothetical protein